MRLRLDGGRSYVGVVVVCENIGVEYDIISIDAFVLHGNSEPVNILDRNPTAPLD